ncbi:MAG: hypothetical protein WCJ03_03985 [Bacteroidales bacterium]
MNNERGRLTEDLEKAKLWALKNLSGKKVFHKDISANILFNKEGISHAIYAKTYPEKIELIYNVLEIIKNSTLFSIEKDKKGRPDIKSIYRFVSLWKHKNKEYFVYIIVRENKQGHFFYDHGIIKEKP